MSHFILHLFFSSARELEPLIEIEMAMQRRWMCNEFDPDWNFPCDSGSLLRWTLIQLAT